MALPAVRRFVVLILPAIILSVFPVVILSVPPVIFPFLLPVRVIIRRTQSPPFQAGALHHCEHKKRGHHAASSIADQRQRHACEGDKTDSAAHSQKHLENIHYSKSGRQQAVKPVLLHKSIALDIARKAAQRDAHHLQEAADADHKQTHGKQKPKLLRDRCENEIRLHIRDVLRRTLSDSKPKPAAPGQSKKRLGDLIALTINHTPGITPCLYPDLYMGKQAVSHPGRHAASGGPQRKITVFPGCKEHQKNENQKEDERTSQISGQNQHQHMSACGSRGNRQIFQRGILPQKCRKEKDKQKFDEFRRLEGDSRHRIADPGAMGHLSQNENC